MSRIPQLLCLAAAGAIGAAAAGHAEDAPHAPHAEHRALPGDAPISARSVWQLAGPWTDQTGKPFTLESLRGGPVLLALFYGTCDSVCPIVVRDLQKVEAMLGEADRARTRFVLVTIDPGVDTPERLRDYATKHGLDPARWRLLHGGSEPVRVLANVLGFKYRPSGGGQYSHTIRIVLLDREGVVTDYFDGLERPLEPIAARTQALLAE